MRKLLLLCLVSAAATVLSAVPASATPPSPVNATFTVASANITSIRTANGNTFETVDRTATLTGTFVGTTVDTITVVMHSNGTTSVRGKGACTSCTVDGRTGSLSYRFGGSGTFPTFAAGQYTFLGSDGLAGLHVQGPWIGNFMSATLTGKYHFN